MDSDIVILEETTAIRIEMFHHRIKMVSQNNFVLIWMTLPSRGQVDTNHASQMPTTA